MHQQNILLYRVLISDDSSIDAIIWSIGICKNLTPHLRVRSTCISR